MTELRLIQVGAGSMGRAWLEAIARNREAKLVGLIDLDTDAASAALAQSSLSDQDVAIGTDLVAVAAERGAAAVIDVAVPGAHHEVTTSALFAGLDVLGEKPLAENLAQSLSLVAATQVTGRRFVVSQSRRYHREAFQLRAYAGELGPAGILQAEFFKAPHFGGFRETMPYPLLVDMAIHHFDLARFVLISDPISVYADSFNPEWSWFDGDANGATIFEMSDRSRFVYAGSWCAPGLETSWNARWRLSSELGSAVWNGEDVPLLESSQPPSGARVVDPGSGIEGALRAFVNGIASGDPVMCEASDNVLSLVMVEAALESARAGQRILIEDVLNRAHHAAIAQEQREDVRAVLTSWDSVATGLASSPTG